MQRYLISFYYERIFHDKQIDEAIDIFYNILYTSFKKLIPKMKIKYNQDQFNQLKNIRNRIRKGYKRIDIFHNTLQLNKLINKFNDRNEQLHSQQIKGLEKNLVDQPRRFLSFAIVVIWNQKLQQCNIIVKYIN